MKEWLKARLFPDLLKDQKDAERYRWLREGDNDDLVFKRVGDHWHDVFLPRKERLDKEIDDWMTREVFLIQLKELK